LWRIIGIRKNVTTLLGGLMALNAGVRAPGFLSGVLSQSGAFSIGGRDLVI
jgi:enterochelin esterase-like enzyme